MVISGDKGNGRGSHHGYVCQQLLGFICILGQLAWEPVTNFALTVWMAKTNDGCGENQQC